MRNSKSAALRAAPTGGPKERSVKKPAATAPRALARRLREAAARMDPSAILEGLRAGADAREAGSDGKTALMLAAESESWPGQACAEAWTAFGELARRSDPDARDKMGMDALMRACRTGNPEAARLLAGLADREARDKDGWGALHWACRNGHAEIASLLAEAGWDAAERDGAHAPREIARACGKTEVRSVMDRQAERDELFEAAPAPCRPKARPRL